MFLTLDQGIKRLDMRIVRGIFCFDGYKSFENVQEMTYQPKIGSG